MNSKLYRSKNETISGVCGGIAEYFSIDPTIIKILWAILTIIKPLYGILGYIVCAAIIPKKTDDYYEYEADYKVNLKKDDSNNENSTVPKTNQNRNTILIGTILIIIGLVFILKQFIFWFDLDDLWPILLIIAGFYIIFKKKNNN